MDYAYECYGHSIEVLHGELFQNRNTNTMTYAAICRCRNGLLLVSRTMPSDAPVEDHVGSVFAHTYDVALKHAMKSLSDIPAVFVAMFQVDNDPSFYHIFKGYDVDELRGLSVLILLKWAADHNDMAEPDHLYTKIIAGHQQRIRF